MSTVVGLLGISDILATLGEFLFERAPIDLVRSDPYGRISDVVDRPDIKSRFPERNAGELSVYVCLLLTEVRTIVFQKQCHYIHCDMRHWSLLDPRHALLIVVGPATVRCRVQSMFVFPM